MKKKSKKRIPQDVKPWLRASSKADDDGFWISGKKTVRWVSGNRRDRGMAVLNRTICAESARLFMRYFLRAEPKPRGSNVIATYFLINCLQKLSLRAQGSMHKLSFNGAHKNFCLISGRARTYNRSIFIARHDLRKLAGVGLISGLIK